MSNKITLSKLVIGFTILAVAASFLLVQTGFAQSDPEDAERFADELKRSGDSLDERYKSQLERVELKRAFVEILQERQENELNERESEDKERRLSLFAYEFFYIRSRLVMEELKLWQIESLIDLQSVLGTEEESKAINLYFEELLERRGGATEEILELSEKLGPYITDPHIKNQFDFIIDYSLLESAEY